MLANILWDVYDLALDDFMGDITLYNLSVPISDTYYCERKKFITIPLGPLYLASYMEANGYKVDFKDYQLSNFENPYDIKNILSFFESSSDILGVSSLSVILPHLLIALKELKKNHPEKTIILGGYGPGGVAEEIIRHFSFVDVVVRGEGEKTLLETLDYLKKGNDLSEVKGIVYRDGGKVRVTAGRERIENLDELPFPAYDKIDIRKYTDIGVISSRGCSYSCSFCDISPTWQGRFTYRSLENVIDEIKLLNERYNIRNIRIFDNIFLMRNIEEFCNLLKKEKLDIKWTCYARVDLMNRKLMEKMSDNGCYGIFYGVESGSDKVLTKIGKKFTAKQAERVVLETKKYIRAVRASFIFGFPFETYSDFIKTYKLLTRLSRKGIETSLSRLCPTPNSKIYHDYKNVLQFDVNHVSEFSLPRSPSFLSGERADIIEYIKKYPTVFPTFYSIPTSDIIKKDRLYDELHIQRWMEYLSPVKPYIYQGGSLILVDEKGCTYELHRAKNTKRLPENPYIEVKISDNLSNLYEDIAARKPDVVLLDFKIKKTDLKITNGRRIAEFLSKLRNSKINFKLAHSLPRCVFDLATIRIAKNLGVSTTCKECLKLIDLKLKNVAPCKLVDKSLNYKEDEFTLIRKHFDVFHKENKNSIRRKCKNCIFHLRKQCTCYQCI